MDKRVKHGYGKTREAGIFAAIKQRCNNPNHHAYDRYGGRGIKCLYAGVAEFISDVGLSPTDKHEIDRKDNSGNYEAGNCQWVLPKQNSRNRRDNKLITYNGETRTMAEWAEVSSVPYKSLHYRLSVAKWDIEKALTTPVPGIRLIAFEGELLTLAQIARKTGLAFATLAYRYKHGATDEQLAQKNICQQDELTGRFIKQLDS